MSTSDQSQDYESPSQPSQGSSNPTTCPTCGKPMPSPTPKTGYEDAAAALTQKDTHGFKFGGGK